LGKVVSLAAVIGALEKREGTKIFSGGDSKNVVRREDIWREDMTGGE